MQLSVALRAPRSTKLPRPSFLGSPGVVALVVGLATLGFIVPGLAGATPIAWAPAPTAGHAAAPNSLAPPLVPLARSPLPGTAHPALGAPVTANPSFSQVRMGSLASPYAHLGSWGPSGLPPGSPYPVGPVPSGAPSSSNGVDPNQVFNTDHCSGLYPLVGESAYIHDCYGHDEPVMEFYSNQPGSGGNISYNVTLPIDRNATQNQSDLYVAMWFGMTMTDPFGWLDQCFLELQFYPDQTWYNGPGSPNPAMTVNGAWNAAAVAWQIEATNGFENACFYQPAFLHNLTYGQGNGSYLNMSQGDRIGVVMTGWVGDPYGENLSIVDYSNGQWANITMFNATGNYPVDPAYATNQYENSLQWGYGETPVTFSFETGHTFIAGGGGRFCTAGAPPPTAGNPYTPCPSYDPGSWINDSLEPWHISVPQFFNATARTTPTSVGFEDDQQGIALVDTNFGYTTPCVGNEGSAWCSYPWYSYSCALHAFEFGATDYPGVSEDFGKYQQYNSELVPSPLGYRYTIGTNFSVPACGAPSYSLTVSTSGTPGGAVYFLSQPVTTTSTYNNLLPGVYALHALGVPGAAFLQWSISGGVAVDSTTSAFTTVTVTAGGTVNAVFGSGPPTATVTFDDVGAPGTVSFLWSIVPGFGTPSPTELASGGSLDLASGAYQVVAQPPPGYNFSYWSEAGGATTVAAPPFPISDLIVDGGGGAATVTAHYVPSTSNDTVYLYVYGNGSVSLNGTPVHESSSTFGSAVLTLRVGTYALQATPGADHWLFSGWNYGGDPIVFTNQSNDTQIAFENGSSFLAAYFFQAPNLTVTLDDSPAAGGGISTGFSSQPNGTTNAVYSGITSIEAVPAAGYSFSSWSVDNGANLWAFPASASNALLIVNHSGTVTAHYLVSPAVNLTFFDAPAAGGSIAFNFHDLYSNDTVNSTLAKGTFAVTALPAPGYTFTGWNWSGNATVSGGRVTVVGAGGSITANFSLLPPPPIPRYNVSFAGDPPTVFTAQVNGTVVGVGDSVLLRAGTYALNASVTMTNFSFVGWTTAGGLAVGNASRANTTLTVTTGGTVYALGAPFVVASVALSPTASVDVGTPVTFRAFVNGSGPFTFNWSGLPSACPSLNNSTVHCTPNIAGVYPVSVTISTPDGSTATSLPVVLTVVINPAVDQFNASLPAFTLGTATTFRATITGGLLPYTIAYTGLPTGCASADAATLSCTPTATGTFSIEIQVTDQAGRSAFANTSVTVNAAPQVTSFTIAPSAVTVGVSATFTVVVAHGTSPFTDSFTGLPAGCVAGSANTGTLAFGCAPGTSGAFTVNVTVHDLSGVTATGSATLQVNPAPTVTGFAASATNFVLGNTTTLTVTATGGTGTLAYSYTGLPAGCSSANSATLSCTPSAAGTSTVTVTVTDSQQVSGQKSTSFTATAPVVKPPHNGGNSTTGGLSSLDYGIIALVAALVVIGIIAAVVSRRRSRPPPQPWQDSAAPGSASGGPPPGATDGAPSEAPGPKPPS
ncbi:MAG: hypothetical protein L3J87_01810 [Thermoplasmata archaeon]|nr:hypothetical protein [Thermoplasmata archaeon]